MTLWKQIVLTAVLGVIGAGVWAVFVPAAQPVLDRIGVLQPLRDAGLIADTAAEAALAVARAPGATDVVADRKSVV